MQAAKAVCVLLAASLAGGVPVYTCWANPWLASPACRQADWAACGFCWLSAGGRCCPVCSHARSADPGLTVPKPSHLRTGASAARSLQQQEPALGVWQYLATQRDYQLFNSITHVLADQTSFQSVAQGWDSRPTYQTVLLPTDSVIVQGRRSSCSTLALNPLAHMLARRLCCTGGNWWRQQRPFWRRRWHRLCAAPCRHCQQLAAGTSTRSARLRTGRLADKASQVLQLGDEFPGQHSAPLREAALGLLKIFAVSHVIPFPMDFKNNATVSHCLCCAILSSCCRVSPPLLQINETSFASPVTLATVSVNSSSYLAACAAPADASALYGAAVCVPASQACKPHRADWLL